MSRFVNLGAKGHLTWGLQVVIFRDSLGFWVSWFSQWLVLETSHFLEVVYSVVVLNMEKCIRTFWPFLTVDLFIMAQMNLEGETFKRWVCHIWGIGAKRLNIMLCSWKVKYFTPELLAEQLRVTQACPGYPRPNTWTVKSDLSWISWTNRSLGVLCVRSFV